MKPTRPELPRQFVAVHKQRRMIAAVAELSADRGYEATKIADIVSRAGVARKTLYDNFDGKEDLFLSAFDSFSVEAQAAVRDACEGAGEDWRQRVEAGLAALLRFLAAEPAAARMCLVEALSATPRSAASYDAALDAFVQLLRASIPPNKALPATLEEALVGGVAWILHHRIRAGEIATVPELAPQLSQFLLSPYLGVADSG